MNSNLQASFKALADPTRRQILIGLSVGDMSIAEVAEQFDMTRAAVRKHLTILEQGELISIHTKGRERINRLEPEALKSIADWFSYFERFWDGKINSLKSAIENEKIKSNEKGANNV